MHARSLHLFTPVTLILLAALVLSTAAFLGCNPFVEGYKYATDVRETSVLAKDKEIANTILALYAKDDLAGALDIDPTSYVGTVYLVGAYETSAQKDRAISLAKSVDGVRSVKTYLLPDAEIAGCSMADNFALAKEVGTRLVADEDVHGYNIDVRAVQCNIVLLGLVSSQTEINRAISIAKNVDGVRKVTSYVRVYTPSN